MERQRKRELEILLRFRFRFRFGGAWPQRRNKYRCVSRACFVCGFDFAESNGLTKRRTVPRTSTMTLTVFGFRCLAAGISRGPRLANGAAYCVPDLTSHTPPPWRALLGRPDPLGSRLLGYGCCFGSARLHNPENRCFRGILFWFYSSAFSDAVIIHHCRRPRKY